MSDTKQAVRDALLAYWRDLYPPEETMLASRIVVVAEVIDSDGDETLRVSEIDDSPPWTRLGMLHAAVQCTENTLAAGWEGDEQ